ncbi:MAG: hypothetical protein VYD87_07235 [Pseudomonadota bacterium]|nr:hypothetical protein [Pseudomonadota bacterium]MEE3100539.1 hypothetical protein [Pseudomonadota bacterium]
MNGRAKGRRAIGLRTSGLMALAAALVALALLGSAGEARAHGAALASVSEPAAAPDLAQASDARPCCHAAAGGTCAALAAKRAGLAPLGAPAPSGALSAPGRLRPLAAPAPGVPPPISGRGRAAA